ncbi:MAG: hypothetical protein JST91_19935 [Actinobacteria bacterium]|nr:hypothetical protein [Actinomycetota bacterium]
MDELSAPAVDLGVLAAVLAPSVKTLSFAPVDGMPIVGPRRISDSAEVRRAHLILANADDPSCRVIGGYTDALLVFADEDEELLDVLTTVGDQLDYREQVEALAELVAGPLRADERWISDPTLSRSVAFVFLLDVFVDPLFRGHDFGLELLRGMVTVGYGLAGFYGSAIPMVMGHISPGTPAAIASHWSEGLGASLTDYGLMILKPCADLHDLPFESGEVITQRQQAGYITIDVAGLRRRFASGDDTLTPSNDGRIPPPPPIGPEPTSEEVAEQCAEVAVKVAVEADASVLTDRTEVVTSVKFRLCTKCDRATPSDVIARAASYLDEHRELDVLAMNWSTVACELDTKSLAARNLQLDLVVRQRIVWLS